VPSPSPRALSDEKEEKRKEKKGEGGTYALPVILSYIDLRHHEREGRGKRGRGERGKTTPSALTRHVIMVVQEGRKGRKKGKGG